MSNVNNNLIHNNDNNKNIAYRRGNEPDIRLEDISIMYTTTKQEDDRGNFFETFEQVDINSNESGKKFLEALKSNKSNLCEDLSLSSEEYDNLACVALALASQETGMGEEKGYNKENKGIHKIIRSIAKFFDKTSASSGLTQMKIYDFLNSDKLTDDQKELIKNYGIKAKGKSSNNLYNNPDLSAIATIIVLSSISDNYGNYQNTLAQEHSRLEQEFIKKNINPESIETEGKQLLNDIVNFYENIDTNSQTEIRQTLKQLFLSQNGTKISDKKVEKDYNEEFQLNKLNELLKKNNANFTLDETSLNKLRYVLTEVGQEMTKNEYLAYGWNKGTGQTGMQSDRLLADKIGTLLSNPENFDYDQFTVNVNTLATMYAYQSMDNNNKTVYANYFSDGFMV